MIVNTVPPNNATLHLNPSDFIALIGPLQTPLVRPNASAKAKDASRNPFMSSIDFNLFNNLLEQEFLSLIFSNLLLSIVLVDNGEIQRIVATYSSRSFLNTSPFPGAPGLNLIS